MVDNIMKKVSFNLSNEAYKVLVKKALDNAEKPNHYAKRLVFKHLRENK